MYLVGSKFVYAYGMLKDNSIHSILSFEGHATTAFPKPIMFIENILTCSNQQ